MHPPHDWVKNEPLTRLKVGGMMTFGSTLESLC